MFANVFIVRVCLAVSDSFAIPWAVAHHTPLFMESSRQKILKWFAVFFSRGSSRPRDQTHISCIAGRFFATEPPGKHTTWKILVQLTNYVAGL